MRRPPQVIYQVTAPSFLLGAVAAFVFALSFFTLSLVDLVREARISLHDIGHHKQWGN